MQPLENIIKINTFVITQFIYTFITLYIYCFLIPFVVIKNKANQLFTKILSPSFKLWGEGGPRVPLWHFTGVPGLSFAIWRRELGSGARVRLPLSYHVVFFSLPSGNIGKLKIINYDCNHRLERNRFLWLGCRL